MKVLLLTDSDAFAGTERHLLDLATSLVACGVSATIGCPAHTPLSRSAESHGLSVWEVPRDLCGGVRAIRGAIDAGRFDLAHAHNGRSAMLAAAAGVGRASHNSATRPTRRRPLITTRHFISLARESRGGLRGVFSRRAHGWLNARITAVIAISDAVAASSRAKDPAVADRLVRIHNGSVLKRVDRSARERVRAALSIGGSTRVLLSVARLEPEKDVSLLVEAAAHLDTAGGLGEWVWMIAGDGSQADWLRGAAHSAGLGSDRLRFLGSRDDVPELMAAADLLVHSAPAEPFGLVLTEAMAAELPVIAACGGAAPEIVVDGVTGWLFEPGTPGPLTDAVRSAIRVELPELQRRGNAGRLRFERCFTAARMASETAAVYRNALTPWPRCDVPVRDANGDTPLGGFSGIAEC